MSVYPGHSQDTSPHDAITLRREIDTLCEQRLAANGSFERLFTIEPAVSDGPDAPVRTR